MAKGRTAGAIAALLLLAGGVAVFPGQSRVAPPVVAPRESVDWLLTRAVVVTMDAAGHLYRPGAVAIRGARIVDVGEAARLEARYVAAHRLVLTNAIVVPGLINGHTHAPMTLFRGLADDLALRQWLEQYIFPAEARFVNPEFVRIGTELAAAEMIRSGTTTFADMYYFEDTVAAVVHRVGLRAVLGETILDHPAPDFPDSAAALAATEQFLNRWQHDPLIRPAVAPHAIYTCSAETLRRAADLARRHHAPLLMHVAETRKEVEDSLREHGRSPVAYLDRLGVLGPDVTAAHCVWVDAADRRLLAERGTGCVYNPSSNLKLASGMAPVVAMLADGVAVGLGTDGAASNNNLDLLREIDFAAKLQKLATGDPASLPARQALALATREGARALHLEALVGTLEPGKQADLTVLALDRPRAVPLFDPYSQIVYALEADDVRDVFVAGRPLLLDGRLTTLDEAAVLERARRYARRIEQALRH